MDAAQHRFTELFNLALDEACTDAEWDEYVALQKAHPHFASEVVEILFAHNLLQYQSDDLTELVALELVATAEDETSVRRSSTAMKPAGARGTWWAAAAVVLLVAGAVAWFGTYGADDGSAAIAQIAIQDGVEWTENTTAVREGDRIVPGLLETRSGNFTLAFPSGPTVRVVGPASLRIESAMHLVLDRGQATARVPESSKGFAIQTPVATVVDQGTEFGVVARDDGMTDVVVFEGRVDVRDTAGAPVPPRSLIIGDAARINALGSVDRIMEMGRDTSGQWWTSGPKTKQRLIASINDNIVSDVSDMFTCYQTTYGGLQDDVLAYADNPNHQWNGLAADGMPDFLRGADYIKTFNDYRYRQDFQLMLEIAKPANLYVFADNRIPPPAWLKDQFEDTGVDIGLDEGAWLYQAPEEYRKLDKNTTDVGGGKSIDNMFSVWHRRCTEPGPVTLGDAGKWATEGKQGRAMYGIAATPLDDPRPIGPASAGQ